MKCIDFNFTQNNARQVYVLFVCLFFKKKYLSIFRRTIQKSEFHNMKIQKENEKKKINPMGAAIPKYWVHGFQANLETCIRLLERKMEFKQRRNTTSAVQICLCTMERLKADLRK